MSRGRFRFSSSDVVLWWIGGGIIFAVLVVGLLVLASGGDAERVRELQVPARFEPVWTVEPQPPRTPTEEGVNGGGGPELLVYLDTSHSMEGFIPRRTPEKVGFRTAAQLVPGHLVGEYGGVVEWRLVDRDVQVVGGPPRFDPALFRGSATRLGLAVEEIATALDSGSGHGAAVITDLVATAGADGPMGVAAPIVDWLETGGAKVGRMDLGILAVRATYWGMRSSTCPGSGELGCWYSEHAKKYLPLSEPVERPFYILLFGMTEEGGGATVRDSPTGVEAVGRNLASELEELGLEVQWELLTQASRSRKGSLQCTAGHARGVEGAEQFALYLEEDGRFRCQGNDAVVLNCRGVLEGQEIGLHGGRASWSAAEVRSKGAHVELILDCGQLRNERPSRDLTVAEVWADLGQRSGPSWAEWTAETDEVEQALGGTLQMDLFADTVRLRPRRYRVVTTEPLLRVAPQ